MSNVGWMKRTTHTLPSGAVARLRRFEVIATRWSTEPHALTCMMSDDVRLAIQNDSCASAGMQSPAMARTRREVIGASLFEQRSGEQRGGRARTAERVSVLRSRDASTR